MALSDAVTAIRARAESLWPSLEAAVPLAWRNDPFDKPVDGNGAPLPFVALDVRWNGGETITIGAPGSNRVRREGHIWAFAFIAQGAGQNRAHQLAGEFAGIFENQDFAGIVCEGMQPGGEADSEDGNLYGQSAAVPFYFDETA
jgi:hypothetical protein